MDPEDEFQRIAVHFFLQFLELKVMLDRGDLQKPKRYDREIAQYKKAAEQFKKAAQDMAERNGQLEDELAAAEERAMLVHGQLNEALVNLGRLQAKVKDLGLMKEEVESKGYKFTELMSEDSKRRWNAMMKEIPYKGTHDAS